MAGSAVVDKSLSEFAMENSLGGFEFLSCIPGTVGGGTTNIVGTSTTDTLTNKTIDAEKLRQLLIGYI